MTNIKKYKKLHQALMDATYAEVYMLKQNFKKTLGTGKDFSENKELNKEVKRCIEAMPGNDLHNFMTHANDLYEFIAEYLALKEKEQEFNNIIEHCYELVEFKMVSSFDLALAFYDFYHLSDKEIWELYGEVELEDMNYFEALGTFKESKLAKDLMIFIKSFSKARKVSILEGFEQAKNFNRRMNIIDILIEVAGLEKDRLDFPKHDRTFNTFTVKDITRKEEKILYDFYVNEEVKKITDFVKNNITLITV